VDGVVFKELLFISCFAQNQEETNFQLFAGIMESQIWTCLPRYMAVRSI
jgi:hypothetical protein